MAFSRFRGLIALVQAVLLTGRMKPSYVRRACDTGISDQALRDVGRWHPSGTSELARQTKGLTAYIAIIGVLPGTENHGAATADEVLRLATAHPERERPRLSESSGCKRDYADEGQACCLHSDHRFSGRREIRSSTALDWSW